MSETVTTRRGDVVALDRRGAGPAVVFVVGAGPHRGNDPMTDRTAELAAGAGLITMVPDRLGRGESPADGLVDLERDLEALAAVIDAAGGHAGLCGHSSGCAIALAAVAEGLPVDALALWEPPFGAPGAETAAWAAGLRDRLERDDLEAAFLHYMRDVPPQFVDGWRASGEYDAMVAQAGSLLPDAQALAWAHSAPWPELFSGVGVPVEVVVGADAFPGLPEAAAALADAVPGARLDTVAGAHHTWDPDPMAQRLAGLARSVAEG